MIFLITFGIMSLLTHIFPGINSEILEEPTLTTPEDAYTLFDFTKNDNAEDWSEQSDTRREVGMSKAVFVTQQTQVFQRAIFFSLLNPQQNGACFAGARIKKDFNLSQFKLLHLRMRGQGENINYKVVLRHHGLNDEPYPTYEQFFSAPYEKFDLIVLPLKDFKPFYRGKPVKDADPLDISNITCVGIQIYGGVYANFKQTGSSSLEIDWIKAV